MIKRYKCTMKQLADHNVSEVPNENLVRQRGEFFTASPQSLATVVTAFLTPYKWIDLF